MTLKLTAKCTACKHTWTMTPEQIREAQDVGVAWSPCCNTIAVVDRAAGKVTR
jgi:hypothetical protein